jgi:sarcosine oxidase
MTGRTDVLIAGGGVMGSAIAYFLTADPAFDGEVLVVERDPTYAMAATTLSWGGIRQQFSMAENIRMSMFGARFAKEAPERLAVEGERPDLGFREQGYLFLASPSGLPVLEANYRVQGELGAAVSLLAPEEIADRFPWLSLDGIAAGGFGNENQGWIDPSSLLQALRRKAQAQGARYVKDEVVGIGLEDRRIAGATLKGGGRLTCGILVNAAGPQAGALAALAGAELPVRPRKRMSYVFDCRDAPPLTAPLTIDTTGVAFRPEGRQYIAIISPPADQDPDSQDLEPEYDIFDEVIWPALAARVPAFEAIKLIRAWAGHYDYNTFDQNAVLGPHPEIGGLLFCNGFSGHGLQQAPAAGRAIAELIVHGAYRSLDLGRLDYERILEGRPEREANIV